MSYVLLHSNGLVSVNGQFVPGKWHGVGFGAGYFEDPGVLCTDVHCFTVLKRKLLEIYGDKMEQSGGD